MELTKKNLTNWLEAKHPNDYVGTAGSMSSCPLANFIVENKPNIRYAVVLTGRLMYGKLRGKKEWSKRLPAWGIAFVNVVDDRYEEVTAGDALNILKGL